MKERFFFYILLDEKVKNFVTQIWL